MSNHEALTTIDSSDLALVHGGDGNDTSGQASVSRSATGEVAVSGQAAHHSSNYSMCLDSARRTANEAYPDTRSLWSQLTSVFTGERDGNGLRRANYERDGIRACGNP